MWPVEVNKKMHKKCCIAAGDEIRGTLMQRKTAPALAGARQRIL
jgi:hypothetical protein